MILDVEQAMKEYFENNIIEIVGNGNYVISVYAGTIPDDSESECLQVELDTPGASQHRNLFLVRMRITTRARSKQDGFILFQNMDLLIDRRAEQVLTDTIEMCTCLRISGPDHFISPSDDEERHYQTGLYDIQFRKYA